ncbi:hypothetical protein [Hymenobacter rubidus]|uniref:hypothetical protein n=1 Tax=Hymenobacter rubidus TaxID=1441626 RepID=UPI00191FD3F5|nr:hypothetical protein [Hymenobacter rubidus]
MDFFTSVRAVLPRWGVLATLCLGAAAVPSQAQTAPTWAAVRRLPAAASTGFSSAESIAVAADGSQYVSGRFAGSFTLGSITMTGSTNTGHLYLAKYSAAGAVLWATKLDAGTQQVHAKVAIDATGNAYLAGDFYNSLTLGNTTLTATVSSAGNALDAFLVKYDAQGVQQWVRQAVAGGVGNTGVAFLYGVATDASGNVTIAGDFLNNVSFGGTPLTGGGVYLYRFSPTGTLLLSRRVSDDGYLNDLALDGAGNAYLTGGAYSNTSFGGIVPPNAGSGDVFLCKLNAAGTVQWVQTAGGPDDDAGTALALDGAGNAVVGGFYASDRYVARFTAQGAPVWTRRIAGPANGYYPINGVVYDGRGGFLVTGRLVGTALFGATTLASTTSAAYVVRYDGQGTAVWAGQTVNVGTNDSSGGYALAADAAGNTYFAGYAVGSVQFGTLPVSTGGSDAVVARLTAGSVLAARTATAEQPLTAFPNPAAGSTTLQLPAGGGRLVFLDALGRPVREQALPTEAGPYAVSLSGLAAGLYRVRALLNNGQVASTPLDVR